MDTQLKRRTKNVVTADFDPLLKLLVIGDSGSGKSTLILRFTSNTLEDLSSTVGDHLCISLIYPLLRHIYLYTHTSSSLVLIAFFVESFPGVDFREKHVTIDGKKLKHVIWDTGLYIYILYIH